MNNPNRNSQKRIIFKDACYFVTFYTKRRHPYFGDSIFCDLFVENLKFCKQMKGFLLYGWVIIYEHIHLMIQPNDESNISDVMFSIKKQFSHNVNKVMGYNKIVPSAKCNKVVSSTTDFSFPESDQALGRFQEMGKDKGISTDKLRFQKQITHNFDLKVLFFKTRFTIKYLNQKLHPKFKWQKSFHDHYERCDNDFNNHLEYIAWNPTKHNLPINWKYVYTNPKYENLTDNIL